MGQRYSGYTEIYRGLLPRLASLDFNSCAGRLGGEVQGDALIMPFLGRLYRIGRTGVEPVDVPPADVNSRSVLIYYLTSQGAGEPSHEFVPLNSLTGLIEGHRSPVSGMMALPLVRQFGENPEGLSAAVRSIGGVSELPDRAGKHSWLITALPKIPIRLVLYEADNEFPAEIQILPDKTATRFLDFECLAFLCGSLVKSLLGKW